MDGINGKISKAAILSARIDPGRADRGDAAPRGDGLAGAARLGRPIATSPANAAAAANATTAGNATTAANATTAVRGATAPATAGPLTRAPAQSAVRATEMDSVVRDMSARAPVDSAKVDKVRSDIAAGSFQLKPDQIATAMIKSEAESLPAIFTLT